MRTPVFASLRARLIAVMILGLGATVVAVVALTYLARTSREQRTIRARDRVEAEVERLSEVAPNLPRSARAKKGRHGLGELRSGFVDAPEGVENPWLVDILRQATSAPQPIIAQTVTADGMPMVAGAAALDGGGYVWAIQRVVFGSEMNSFRGAVLCLVVVMFFMVLASVQTLVAFDRGAGTLRESVVMLGRDLRAKVPRPKLRELAEVADGLDSLAEQLLRSQEDKGRLMSELAEHERWAALGRVVAGVAHEVRNPLAAIKLRTDLAEGATDIPAPVRDDLALIGSEVARLDRLVRDLLLLADRRTEPRVRTPTDLAALVATRTELLLPWAKDRGVSLASSGTALALVDVDALTRAVDNLLRNAVEASPDGETVTAAVSEAGGKARVSVSDAGPGVKLENEALVFEPFFTTKPTGTGLGLALSRAVAETHGGSLTHARADGRTQFTLEIAKG